MDSYSTNSKITFGNGRERILAVVLALVGLIAIGFIIATIILGVKYTNKDVPIQDKVKNDTKIIESLAICNTEECVKAAGDILRAMDRNVNPCDDFYQFTCGNWIKNNPVPETLAYWDEYNTMPGHVLRKIKVILETKNNGSEPVPLKNAKLFYKSCMDQNTTDQTELRELTEVVLKIGDVTKNIGLKLGELRRRIMRQFLISLYVDLDQMNSSRYLIYLDQPSLGMDREFFITVDHPNKKAYKELIASVFPLVYPDEPGIDPQVISEKIVGFETKIAHIITPSLNRTEDDSYNLLSLSQFGDLTGSTTIINWEVYINEVFKDVIQNHKIDLGYLPNLTVVVRDLNYFKELGRVLSSVNDEDPTTLPNFLRWRIIAIYGNEVSSTLRNLFLQYKINTEEPQYIPSRWETCCDRANTAFGMAISSQYVREVFSGNFSSQTTEMMGNIRKSVLEIIDKADWIGHKGIKLQAKERVQEMTSFIGFPEWLVGNKSALDIFYQGMDFDASATYFSSFLRSVKWKNMKALQNINKHRDFNEWQADPTFVGAFYSPIHNSLTIPAGYLQPPFYYDGKPIQALNYGAIGTVIGHEISHGLHLVISENVSQQQEPPSNINGSLIEWWDKKGTVIQYDIRADCFVQQYNKFVALEAKNITVDGKNTMEENIADNAGLHQSFNAYQLYMKKHGPEAKLPGLEYNPQQLFFLAYAQTFCGSYTPQGMESQINEDVHTPNQFRVKGVLANSVEFSEVWNCTRPDPKHVCRLW